MINPWHLWCLPNSEKDIIEDTCDLIKRWEGYSPIPYICPAGVTTIGYGFTGSDAKTYKNMTRDEADEILKDKVIRLINKLSKAGVEKRHIPAFASLAYNVGITRVLKSQALKCYKKGDLVQSEIEFKEFIKANGQVLQGLVNRRNDEWN